MVADADIRFVKGDVRPVHREMVAAAAGKNVWIVGGGDLAGQFYDQGLLDQLTSVEVLDLLAYLVARGDRNHAVYKTECGHEPSR